jgi:hypothetical protein
MLLLLFRAKNLAIHFLWNSFSFKLTSLAFGLDRTITESLSNLLLDLRSELFCVNNGIHLLLVGLNLEGVAADILEVNQIIHVSGDFCENLVRLIITAYSDAVAFAAMGSLVKNLNWSLVHIDRLLFSECMARDILKILAKVTGTSNLLKFSVTRSDHTGKRVIEGILELTLTENVLSAGSMMWHLQRHV